MSKLVTIWTALLSIVPTVFNIVKAVELPGNGLIKLEAVTACVVAGLDLLSDDLKKLIPVETLKAFVKKVVEAAVALYNVAGVFKKSDPPQPTA